MNYYIRSLTYIMLVAIGASEESPGDPTALVSYICCLFFIKLAKDLSCFVEYYVVIMRLMLLIYIHGHKLIFHVCPCVRL